MVAIHAIKKKLPLSLRKKLPSQIGIIGISPKVSRRLNKIYRGKDKATNVLSFFYSKKYAEILVCPAVVQREARAQKHSYKYQMTWMVLHGTLHLAGIHHERSKLSADRAEKLEQNILSKIFK